jgi:uncharacterized Tic20 family protein
MPETTDSSPAAGMSDTDAKNLAMWCHYLNVIWLVPLILYLMKKGKNAFFDKEAKEVLNWVITCFIASVAIGVVSNVLAHIVGILGMLVSLVNLAIFVAAIFFGIQGGNKAKTGQSYSYPFAIRLIK